MNRRHAVAALIAALAAPAVTRAQSSALPRLGYLSLQSITERPSRERQAFLDGLREYGRVPGESIEIVYRSAENEPEFLRTMCEELLGAKVDVLATPGALSTLVALKATHTVPIVFLVVYDMLLAQGGLKAGEWLLVTGVTSGVGVAALQTGRALGAKVIGTSGSAEKLEKLKPLGLDVAVATRKPEFADAVMKATGGKGANLCVNNVGGTVFPEILRCLAFEGRLAIVGYTDGVLKAEVDLDTLHAKRLRIFGVSNKLRNAEQRSRTVRGFSADILPMLADGRIRPLVDKVYKFEALPEAKARMDANAHVGKIVVTLKMGTVPICRK